MITVVGLGVEKGDLTKKGEQAILSADKVLVRTNRTKSYQSVVELGVEHETLDFVYERCRKFSSLNKKLASTVRAYAKKYEKVVYCVDGSSSEDNSVKELLKGGKISLCGGVSKVSAIAEIVSFAGCSYTALSAYELSAVDLPTPLIVYDMDDRHLAGEVKYLLSDLFGEEEDVWYIFNGKKKKIPLFELDRMKEYNYTSAVAIEKRELLDKSRFTFRDLEEIIRRLRRPDGCPWDRVQTPESIKMNGVEEAYELLDAIDQKDSEKILEETGDLLMQVVFHAVMQEERGEFNLTDVVYGVCNKLITRHTHIFGGDSAADAESALLVWDKNKMKEKNQDTFCKAVNDVPKCFPALMQAQKVAKRVKKGGWDFTRLEKIKEKLQKDFAELKEGLQTGDQQKIQGEIGDILMDIVWLGLSKEVDMEESLLSTIRKVQKRFERFENAVLTDGKEVLSLTEEEWDSYYALSKSEGVQ